MIDVLAVGGGTVGGVTIYALYDRLTGCRGGHVWGEWESTDRRRITPFGSTDDLLVEKQYERHCERSECIASETEYRTKHVRVYAESLTIDVVETHYRCPRCEAVVSSDERSTEWVQIRHGGERRETCPQCKRGTWAGRWARVPYEEVQQ